MVELSLEDSGTQFLTLQSGLYSIKSKEVSVNFLIQSTVVSELVGCSFCLGTPEDKDVMPAYLYTWEMEF